MGNEIVPAPDKELLLHNEDHLSRVVTKALNQLEAILDQDLSKLSPEMAVKTLSIKKDAASTIINAGLKADENRFRRENNDIIEKLFKKIKKESTV